VASCKKVRWQDYDAESSQGRVGTYTFTQELQGAQAEGNVNEERVALLSLRLGPEFDSQRVKASDGRTSVVKVDVVEIGVLQKRGEYEKRVWSKTGRVITIAFLATSLT